MRLNDAARRSRRAALRAAGARDGGAHGDRLARCRALPFTNPSSLPSPCSSSPPHARSRLLFPAAQVVAAGTLFGSGVILNGGDAIERLDEADTIVFDKTER
jgi:hypothetical protein